MSFQQREFTPASSRMRVRENRSPSKVYEDTLIVERKIKSFGLFSEDLSWILMGLLRDNEEVKNLVKIGFKEIEREMGELDQCQKTERNERTRENFELKKLISSSSEEKEEKLFKLEKDFNAKLNNMKDKLHTTFEEFQDKVSQQIEEKFAEKLPEVFDKLNDMSAKMSLGV